MIFAINYEPFAANVRNFQEYVGELREIWVRFMGKFFPVDCALLPLFLCMFSRVRPSFLVSLMHRLQKSKAALKNELLESYFKLKIRKKGIFRD